MNYNWNWLVFFDLEPGATGTYLSYLFGGLGWTVIAALASWILALSLGTLVGVLRTLGNPVLEKVCFVYVELFRNVPLLVQMFLWYFVFPELLPEEGKPRARLAVWVTHPENIQAARAAVSHVWALMFGRSMGEAVDNLPLDELSHPMMDTMARDFVAHGFNIRRLVRVLGQSSRWRIWLFCSMGSEGKNVC